MTSLSFKGGRKCNLSEAHLIDLIESVEGAATLKSKKEEATYIRQLRNHIHDNNVVTDIYALEAINHMQQIVLTIYPNPAIYVRYTCICCRKSHDYKLSATDYYPGAKFTLECLNPPQSSATTTKSASANTETWIIVNI